MIEAVEGAVDAMETMTFSFQEFRFVTKEVTERLKVCSSASSYMEDISEIESTLGRSLAKIGKQPIELAKPELMSGILTSWETAMKIITEFTGKHHSNISFVISQNISKVLSDVFRLNNKRAQDITNKIKSQHQELLRSKQSHLRRHAKYLKSVKDAELSIRQRYAALEAENRAGKEKEKPDSLTKDENFVKSFSKMIAKIAPVDSQKRWNEKFSDIIKDLDTTEAILKSNSLQLNASRDLFLTDVHSALDELQTLELNRLSCVQESLTSLSNTQSLICDEEKEAYCSLLHKVESIDIDEEISALLWSVDQLVINDVNANDPFSMNDSEKNVHIVSADYYSADRTKSSGVIFHKVQQTLEVLDFLRNLVSFVGTSLKSVSEVKKSYAKAIAKCFEKHGLTVMPGGSQSPPSPCVGSPLPGRASMKSMVPADSLKRFQSQLQSATGLDSSVGGMFADLIPETFAELLFKTESPTSIAVWAATVLSFGGVAESHMQTAEKYFEFFLPTLSSIQRRIYAIKNDLMSKQISNMKLIDNSQAAVLKLSQKIEKIRYLVKIQQEKVEKSKEEVTGGGCYIGAGGGGGNRLSLGSDGSSPPKGMEAEEDLDSVPVSRCRSNSNDDDVISRDDGKKDRDREGDKGQGGRGKASKIMQQGLDQFGSRLQKARATVAANLGTENQEDRLERREVRMVALELEEKELLSAFYAASASMDAIEEAVRMEIDDCLKAAKEVICHDISSFVDILKQLSQGQRECVGCFEGPVKRFQTLCESLDFTQETAHFNTTIRCSFLNEVGSKNGDKNGSLENPTLTSFLPQYNKVIEAEKTALGLWSDPNRYDNTNDSESDRLSPSHDFSYCRDSEQEEERGGHDEKLAGMFTIASHSESGSEISSFDAHNAARQQRSPLLQHTSPECRTKMAHLMPEAIARDSSFSSAADSLTPLCIDIASASINKAISAELNGQTYKPISSHPSTSTIHSTHKVEDSTPLPDGSPSSVNANACTPKEDCSSAHFSDGEIFEKDQSTDSPAKGNFFEDQNKHTKESLIAELIRQKLLSGDLTSDRSFDGSSASSSACVSPTALPPRPPLPPRSKRTEGKDKEKEKDSEREREKDRINQYMVDRSQVSATSNVSSIGLATVQCIDTILEHSDIDKLRLGGSKSDDEGQVTVEKARDKSFTEEEAMPKKGVFDLDIDERIECDRQQSKDLLMSREYQDSPKVMRIKERGSENTQMVNNATIGVNKKVPQTIGNKPEDSTELVKFGLSPSVRVLESFSCALYPKKGLLTHGRVFITQHYLAFSGWPEMRLLLALKDINRVEKCNTLYYIPNAILVNSETYGEFFFGSFIDRDVCFALLNNMSQIAKRLIEIKRDSNTLSPEIDQLVFGLRVPKPGGVETYLGGIQAKATAGWNSIPTTVNLQDLSGAMGIKMEDRQETKAQYLLGTIGADPMEGDWTARSPVEDHPRRSSFTVTDSRDGTASPCAYTPAPTPAPALAPLVEVDQDNYLKDGIEISDLFPRHSIQSLCTHVLPFSFSDILKSCWLGGAGYGDFLEGEGDIEIGYGDWAPLANPKVPEDVSGLPFSFSREFHYSHPRTTMLMFGPKNAPAKQTHYLYLPLKSVSSKTGNNKESTSAFLGRQDVPKGVVMIITQFDGIPMADCFKIVQYFTFDQSTLSLGTNVRIGVWVHFVKYTLLKAQVRDGVKEELSVLSHKWCTFVRTQVPKLCAGTAGFTAESVRVSTVNFTGVDVSANPVGIESVEQLDIVEDGNTKNIDNFSPQKEKKTSRRLPKIFWSQADEKPSVLGAVKYVIRALFAFLENHFENRLSGLIFICLFVLIATQWRQNLALSRRMHSLEKALQNLGNSLESHANNHEKLSNTVNTILQKE